MKGWLIWKSPGVWRLMINKETVTTWFKRWNASSEAGAHAWGAPDKFTPEQVCLIIAMACESPETYGRPITHWTAQEFAEEVSQQNSVDSISITHTGRLLKKTIYGRIGTVTG